MKMRKNILTQDPEKKHFDAVKWEQVAEMYLLKHHKANGNPEQGQITGSRAGRTDKGLDPIFGAKGANEAGRAKSSKGADEADGAEITEQGLDRALATGLSAPGT